MTELIICKVCLSVNVKMFKLRECALEDYYKSIIGSMSEDNIVFSLQYACYECAYLIRKYYLFKEKCLRGQSALMKVYKKNGKINYSDINLTDRQNLQLCSNLVSVFNNHIEEHYYDIKGRFSINSHGDTIESTSHSKFYDVKIENDVKAESDEIPILDLTNNEQVFTTPIQTREMSKRRKISENKYAHKRQKVKVESPVAFDYSSEESLDRSIKEESPPIQNSKRRIKRSKSTIPKRKTGKKWDPNELTPLEIKMQDKFTIKRLTLEEQLEEVAKKKMSSQYLNSKYKCDSCYKGFSDPEAYNRHVAKHDPAKGSVKCPVCNTYFQKESVRRRHSRNHDSIYVCNTCSFVCKSLNQAIQHENVHSGKIYKCEHCEHSCSKLSSHLSHVRAKHPSEFVCDFCDFSFVSKSGLAQHKALAHKSEMESEKQNQETNDDIQPQQQKMAKVPGKYCQACNIMCNTSLNWKVHIESIKHKTNIANKDLTCSVCKEVLPTGEDLRLHHRKLHPNTRRRTAYGINPFLPKSWPAKCPHCTDELPNAHKYWWHFRKAHPDKQYPMVKNHICDICGKGFKGNAYLQYHRRTHFEERSYKCKQCPKSFFNRFNLQNHVKSHSDNRPYPCSVCFKAFKLKNALDRHFRSHTGVKPYECEVCGKAFGQSNSVKLHVRTVHLKQPAPYISKSRLERRRAAHADKHAPPTSTTEHLAHAYNYPLS